MKTALVYFVLNKSRIDPNLGVDEWYVGRKYNPTKIVVGLARFLEEFQF